MHPQIRRYMPSFLSISPSKRQNICMYPCTPPSPRDAPLHLQTQKMLCGLKEKPQDQSKPHPDQTPPELDFFKTQSVSRFITCLNGPVMWISMQQAFIAISSAKAEMYVTDECTKNILHIMNILTDIKLTSKFIKHVPVTIQNDNNACMWWSKNITTKGLRHVQIHKHVMHKDVSMGLFTVKHIGKN